MDISDGSYVNLYNLESSANRAKCESCLIYFGIGGLNHSCRFQDMPKDDNFSIRALHVCDTLSKALVRSRWITSISFALARVLMMP